MEFNEKEFVQVNTNTYPILLTIELTVYHRLSSNFGFNLISIPKIDSMNFIEAINILKGRQICVGEEWNFNDLVTNDWKRIFQSYVKSGSILEMKLDLFKKVYDDLINSLKNPEELAQMRYPHRQQIFGKREYNLNDTKDQFSNMYEISNEEIANQDPLHIENIITAYSYKSDDYYFDDAKKYYGLFIHY